MQNCRNRSKPRILRQTVLDAATKLNQEPSIKSSVEQALSRFYREKNISVQDFRCPHKELCTGDAGRPLTHGAEAHVGSKYGERLRIAVVSLDTGGGSEDLEKRRSVIESLEAPEKELNRHMTGTIRCLQALLKVDEGDRSVVNYFAMINAAKCAATDGKRDMVPAPLYDRCRPYAQQELALLEPQVIVAQGAKARAILKPRRQLGRERLEQVAENAALDATVQRWLVALGREYVREVSLNAGDFALAIMGPHPSSRQGQWQRFERTCLEPVSWLVRELSLSKAA